MKVTGKVIWLCILGLLVAGLAGCAYINVTKQTQDDFQKDLDTAKSQGVDICAPIEYAQAEAYFDGSKHEAKEVDANSWVYLKKARKSLDAAWAKYNSGQCRGQKPTPTPPPPPSAAPAPKPEAKAKIKIQPLEGVFFDNGKSTIKPEAGPKLDADSKVIIDETKKNPKLSVRIVGYCSSPGSKQLNDKLSLDRANSVKSELVKRGAPANILKTEGRGASNFRVFPDKTEEQQQLNRRVEFEIE